MAREYMHQGQGGSTFSKEFFINVLLSKEFFLLCVGLGGLLLVTLSDPVPTVDELLFLQEKDGTLGLVAVETTEKSSVLSENISFRPFLFQKIPVNIAGKELLQTIPGIGEKTATAILNERNKGWFITPYDLTRVDGIGRKTANQLEHYLSFEIQISAK